jgi:uncharacterized membrane protein
MYYPTFDEETNSFKYEEYTHQRRMSPKERKWDIITDWMIIPLSIIPTIFILSSIYNFAFYDTTWGIMHGVFFIIALIASVFIEYKCTKIYDKIFANSEETGFEDEILRWEQITQEQNNIAEKWRAEHPLEEAIRKAQLSKNSVDIAALARLYAQEIRGE